MRPLFLLLIAGPAFAATPDVRVRARLGDDRFRQVEDVRALTYSPDGRYLASIDGTTVIIWDARDGRRIRTIPIPEREYGAALRYAPDGRSLLVVAQDGDQKRCSRLDPATGAVLDRLSYSATGKSPVFSPTGRYLAMSSSSGEGFNLIDLVSGRPALVRGWAGMNGYDDVVFRPDEKAVAVLTNGREVRLFDLTTGAPLGRPDVRGLAKGLTFTPDGRDLVGSLSEGGVVRFEAATGKVKWSADVRAQHLGVSPDGRTVWYFAAWRWHHLHLDTGRAVGPPIHTDLTGCHAIHPAGHTLATTWGGHISQWDFKAGGRLAASADPPVPVSDLYFTPDGRAARGWANAWYEWDLTTGKQTRLTPVEDSRHGGVVSRDLRWRARGRPIRSRGEDADEPSGAWGFEIEATATGSWRSILPGGEADGWACRLLPTGRLLTTDSDIWTVVDPATGEIGLRVPLPGDGQADVTDDGTQLAALTPTPTGYRLSRWDTRTGRLLGAWAGRSSLNVDQTSLITLRLSPDGRTAVALYAGESDMPDHSRAVALDTETGAERGRWMHPDNDRLAFLPDGRSAVVWSDPTPRFQIREFATGAVRRRMRAPGPVADASLRRDGRAVLVATRPYPVELWSLPAGPKTWDPTQTAAHWRNLADPDAGRAYRAILALRDHPAEAVELLKTRMAFPQARPAEWLKARLAGLDAAAFRDRERAAADLAGAGELVTDDLRRALPGTKAEARARIEKLLELAAGRTPEQLRAIRACEVLETIGTPEARALLAAWSKGAPAATLTREAAASLRRLTPGRDDRREPDGQAGSGGPASGR